MTVNLFGNILSKLGGKLFTALLDKMAPSKNTFTGEDPTQNFVCNNYLMQIWKSANIFFFKWMMLKISHYLLLFEIYAREI